MSALGNSHMMHIKKDNPPGLSVQSSKQELENRGVAPIFNFMLDRIALAMRSSVCFTEFFMHIMG